MPSRRLGLSLGVDLVPYKTCSLDCVYCETGATTLHTLTRDEYVPTADVLAELEDYERDVLYPLATQQVQIDLDDGVKVNYLKFESALKKIPGLAAKDED